MSTMGADQMSAKDLVIGLHVLMKANPDWERFKGHKIGEDRKSLTIPTEDGRQFVVHVYEDGKQFDLLKLHALMNVIPELPTLADIHAAMVAYVDLWRDS
jgi:hypothetical protein